MGSADCSRQAGNHENIIVRAVLMKEWMSHVDVVRSVNKLRVWWSVGACAKMTYGDHRCFTFLWGFHSDVSDVFLSPVDFEADATRRSPLQVASGTPVSDVKRGASAPVLPPPRRMSWLPHDCATTSAIVQLSAKIRKETVDVSERTSEDDFEVESAILQNTLQRDDEIPRVVLHVHRECPRM